MNNKYDKIDLLNLLENELDVLDLDLLKAKYFNCSQPETQTKFSYEILFMDELNNSIFKGMFNNNLNSVKRILHEQEGYARYYYFDCQLLNVYYNVIKDINIKLENNPEFIKDNEAFQKEVRKIASSESKKSKIIDFSGYLKKLGSNEPIKKYVKEKLEERRDFNLIDEEEYGKKITDIHQKEKIYYPYRNKILHKEKKLEKYIGDCFELPKEEVYTQEAIGSFNKGFYGYKSYKQIKEMCNTEFFKLPNAYKDAIDYKILEYKDIEIDLMADYVKHFYNPKDQNYDYDYCFYLSKCYFLGKTFKIIFEEDNHIEPIDYLKKINGYIPNIKQVELTDLLTNEELWKTPSFAIINEEQAIFSKESNKQRKREKLWNQN